MAAANDAMVVTCTNNSDYAVICSFFEQFGDKSGLLFPSFHDLQQMLENVEEVSYPLVELHVKLMRKLKKSVNFDRWEKAAAKYAHSYSDQDGWEIERFGYKKLNLAVKLRLLKNLLEAQFDGNIKFKNEINKVTSDELRLQPLGKDIQGRRYWHQLDDDCNLRVYREDLDEETWDLVSSDKESMLKLIGQLSSDNGLQEDEGTSPATSEENSANGQEEDIKVDSENRVEQLTDGPSETKRLKVETVKDPVVPESKQESIVSEAIESPVLLVTGEGNGADCDTGNPGESKGEESCESHNLNSKKEQLDDTSAIDCESNKLKSCAESSEAVITSQLNSELPDSVPDSACHSLTLSSVRDNLKDTSPEEIDNTSSAASNNVKEQPDSEDCPANPSAANSDKEEITLDSPSRKSVSTVENSLINDVEIKKEADLDEKSICLAPVDIKSNSIEPPSTEVEGFPKNQECTKPSEDEAIIKAEHVDKPAEVDVSNPYEPAVPKTTTENSMLTHNQELPKPDCFSVDVKLDPVQLKSAITADSVEFSNDTVSSDQHPSTSYVTDEETVLPPVCLPIIRAELQETKQIVEPVSIPADSTLIQENSSKIDESHREQRKELKDKCLDDVNYKIAENANTVELEAERSNLSPCESPAKIEVKDEEVLPEIDDSNSLNQRIEPKITSTPELSNDLLKDNQETEISLNTLNSPSATFSASPVPLTSEATHAVSDSPTDCNSPSRSQGKMQCSEDGPAMEDIKKHMDKDEINAIISQPAAESEVAEGFSIPDPTTGYEQSSQMTSASPEVAIKANSAVVPDDEKDTNANKDNSAVLPDVEKDSEAIKANPALVPHVEKDSEVPSCADPINKSVSEEPAVCTDSEPSIEKTNDASTLNSSKAQNEVLDNVEKNEQITPELDVSNPTKEKNSTIVEEKLISVQDEIVSNCVQEIPEKEELVEIKDSTNSVNEPNSASLLIAKDYSIPDIPVKNVSTSEETVSTMCEKEGSSDILTAPAKENLITALEEPESDEIPLVLQSTLKAIQSEGISEAEDKKKILAIPAQEDPVSKQPKLETNSVSQKVEVNEIKLVEVLVERLEAKEKIPEASTGVMADQQELANDPILSVSPKNETSMTEPGKFANDRLAENVDIPAPAKDESMSLKLRAEVFPEIIQKNEPLSGDPKDSFCVAEEPMQTEVIPTVGVKELLSVQQEPELNSILPVPHASESKQTNLTEVLTEQNEVIRTMAEILPKIPDAIPADKSAEVIPENESSAEEIEETAKESIFPATVAVKELPLVQQEPELNSIPPVPHTSELNQTELKEVLTEQLPEKEINPTTAEILPSIQDAIPSDKISEVNPENELSAEKFEGNAEESILPATVAVKEMPLVQQEPELNSIPPVPGTSELNQTELKEVLTEQLPEKEINPTTAEILPSIQDAIPSDEISEVNPENEPSAEKFEENTEESILPATVAVKELPLVQQEPELNSIPPVPGTSELNQTELKEVLTEQLLGKEIIPATVENLPPIQDAIPSDKISDEPSLEVLERNAKESILPALVPVKELPLVQQEPEVNSILPQASELKQTEFKEVLTEQELVGKEIIPMKEDILPKIEDTVPSDKTSDVIPETEPSSEEIDGNAKESILVEEKQKIPLFTQKDECPAPEVPTNAKLEKSDHTTIEPKITGLDAKEELLPVVQQQLEAIPTPENLNKKLSISLPEEKVENLAVADKLIASPKTSVTDVKEEVSEAKLAMHVKEDQEMMPVSKVLHSNPCELVSKLSMSPETTQSVEAKPPPNETEKSSNLNQLTFDFDASTPVAIILPPSKNQDASAKRRGRKRGRFSLGGNDDSGKENDAQPTVLRQSSRIAKLREKEDEDRRKEEADRLQRLKEEHERREKRRSERDERMKKMEEKQQRRQLKTTNREDVTYKESEDESSSSDEEKNSEEEGRKKKDKKEKRRKGKKKIDRPWDSTDSSEKSSESDLDALEDLQVEQENEELEFKSDHEFSPESDLDEEAETVQPTKHARTAKAGAVPKKRSRSKKAKVEEEEVIEEEVAGTEEEEEEEEAANCHKCGQSDHPEWILLCDRCDAGWHANCVKPPLLVIPEGNWFCPPCDHATLMERLQERLEAYEFLLQEKEAELERRKEQELEAKLAKEEAEKQAQLEMEEEAQEDDDEDEKNSGVGDLGADGEDVDDEETSDESGEDEEEEEEDSQNESDENLNGRRQRKAAKQANYSFKDFDDMIKSALRDEGDEEEEEGGKGKGKGKGLRSGVDDNSDDGEDKPRSPPGTRPSGIGNKRISTSDDDSDIMPQVTRKKKARKLNDLSATSNEDDSDEDFQGSSAEGSDSEDDDEDASDSGDSFVVDDDSDDDDVIHVRAKKKARAASPIIRRSARSARKRNLRMDSSDTSEEESEYEEKPTKRKRGNESWDSSGESSSDASWGRSKKRSAAKSKAKPVAATPKPKPKPPPRKAPANRGRGRGGRSNKVESDDEPFRSNVSAKKIKEARPVKAQQDDDESDHAQRRTTRGRQISYKELISSGESQDEGGSTVKKMGTLFAADRNKSMAGAVIRGGASRRGGVGRGGVITSGRGSISGGDTTPVPVSVISSRLGAVLKQDDESRLSGSTDTIEFSAAAASAAAAASVYTTGDESLTSNDILTPSIDPDLATLPIILPQEDVASPLIKDELPAAASIPVLSQDLQVSRLIQQMPADVPPPPTLPPDLQINRLINSQSISSSSNSPARQSPGILPQPRLVRDVLDSQTPPPAVQLPPIVVPPLTQPQIIAPSVELPPLYSHGGVIKQTRHSLPPTPPMYSSPHVVKTSDLIASSTPPSVIRPYPTTVTSSSLSPSISGISTPGNPLSIQGLLGTGHGSPGSIPSVPPSSHPIRPYGNTPHMIGHGPFLNHTPYANPYSAAPPSRTSYMGTPVTPTPRQAYPPMYSSPHLPPHSLPLHSPYQHHGPPLRPTSSYQHAGFPQAFAAAAAAAANAEEERRIYRVAAQASRESGADNFDPAPSVGLLTKSGADDPTPAATAVPPESEFGGLVSYFSSQQEDFEES